MQHSYFKNLLSPLMLVSLLGLGKEREFVPLLALCDTGQKYFSAWANLFIFVVMSLYQLFLTPCPLPTILNVQ